MAAVVASNMSSVVGGHLQTQLTRSLERILEEAQLSGELKLSGRKLKDFPNTGNKYNLCDTVIADLSKNRLGELPNDLTTFLFLERLHLYHNSIRNIPDTVVSLQSLTHLDLSRNQLTVLPKEICQLPLQVLLVASNRLQSLPDELGRMTELTELDASCNQITHLPHHLGDLTQLRSLILRSNLLLCLSIEVTYLQLVRLDIRQNRIQTLPVELRLMRSLVDLELADNPLTSPPAALCMRGRVHIFKYLELEALQRNKIRSNTSGTEVRRSSSRRSAGHCNGSPQVQSRVSSHLQEGLRHKRHNVDSGYSTSDGFDKRWSQEMQGGTEEMIRKSWARHQSSPLTVCTSENISTPSGISTPSTISPGEPGSLEDDIDKVGNGSSNAIDKHKVPPNGIIHREYKEALRQQRNQDVPVYRTRDHSASSADNPSNHTKTEPNTPTHQITHHTGLATSKSDPTPLHSVLSSHPKQIFDDTVPKRPVQKVPPSRIAPFSSPNHQNHSPQMNGNNGTTNEHNGVNNNSNTSSPKYVNKQEVYIKPTSPIKHSTGVLSHDHVPSPGKLKPTSPKLVTTTVGYVNGPPLNNGSAKSPNNKNRTLTWNRDIPPEKLSFTMRREFDKAREESDLIEQLRHIIETRLKMELPEDLAPALTDGVVLCHLANHVKARSVASIHVPSPAVPKLTMARCRRNVDNFLEACRKIGVEEGQLCSSLDVIAFSTSGGREGGDALLTTVKALEQLNQSNMDIKSKMKRKSEPLTTTDIIVSALCFVVFVTTVILLILFPPPD
ncbi:leucine-rich repeat and calponin homology domain-containing protein isoform X2 [Chrysoperla carnea]|uniref:leucine-rich repeat and calponin homology domain-containing protein isoform X2 n=1 Tax=Chrysoperla carnea TaxID=189513 RepID=UPI001D093858|nr:leucine-rich repeat and calponin homology domain-containing protein isoform X2 [Chrysoperla carnea]